MLTRHLFCIALLTTSLIYSQKINTDRPDQTEGSSTIPKFSLQVETGVVVQKNTLTTNSLIPTALIRYGLSSLVELRLVSGFESVSIKGMHQKTKGLSDLEIGAKIQLLKNESVSTEIAFLSHVIIPSAKTALSNGKFGSVNKLSISHSIHDKISFGYNVGYNYFGYNDGDFTYSLALGTPISDNIGIYVESYGEVLNFNNHQASFDTGITYLYKNNIQFDLSFGTGLNHTMNYVSFGVSFNTGKL